MNCKTEFTVLTRLFSVLCFLSTKHKPRKAYMWTYKYSKSYHSLKKLWKWQFYMKLIFYEIIISHITFYSFFPCRDSPYWAMVSSLWRLHDHTVLDTPHSLGIPWTSDQPIAKTFTWHHTTPTRGRYHVSGGVRTPILAHERLETHTLDPATIGIGISLYEKTKVHVGCVPVPG